MRLWHIDLIPYLPKSQLLAQWRELNSIFKKQDKHILINYIYDYSKDALYNYTIEVLRELERRSVQIKSYKNMDNYFTHMNAFTVYPWARFQEHNEEYLIICYWNLREKYLRGQKDFTDEVMENLQEFYDNYFGVKNESVYKGGGM